MRSTHRSAAYVVARKYIDQEMESTRSEVPETDNENILASTQLTSVRKVECVQETDSCQK